MRPANGTLSGQEAKVIELAALGFTQKETAEQMHLSPKTVSVHRHAAYRKMGAANATHAVAMYYRVWERRGILHSAIIGMTVVVERSENDATHGILRDARATAREQFPGFLVLDVKRVDERTVTFELVRERV